MLTALVSDRIRPASGCPEDTVLLAYVEGGLAASSTSTIERHLATCAHCQEILRLFAEATLSPRGSASNEPPTVSARYQLREPLGRGGQGSVWRAWDGSLQREVALKLVEFHNERHRERFQREARALAKLSHPHVLEIYDIDLTGDPGFISIPVCAGSLADELGTDRPWREVLETMQQAAAGLIAVHRAGLVHRDIKPSNLLRDAAGVVKLGDFGLVAERSVSSVAVGSGHPRGSGPGGMPATVVTLTGVCGTPGYLAPEVVEGAPHDAASDQYAFFVTVYQLLTGRLPTARSRWRDSDAVPRWVRRVVERGLHPEPGDRFRSMVAAATALRRSTRRRRMVGVAAVAVALGAIGVVVVPAESEVTAACELREPAPWSEAMRTAIQHSGHPQAKERADALEARMSTFADGWRELDRALCEAGRAEGRRCLMRVVERIDAVTQRLARGDVSLTGIDTVARLMPELISFEHCERIEERNEAPPELDTAAARAAAAAAVHGAYAEELLGDDQTAHQQIATALEHGTFDPFPDLHATAIRRWASYAMRTADLDVAAVEAHLHDAERLAQEADAPSVLARILIERSILMDPQAARQTFEFARAALARAGEPAPERIRLALVEALVAIQAHDYATALERAEFVRREAEGLGSDALRGRALMLLGTAKQNLGHDKETIQVLERAHELLVDTYGASHAVTEEAEYRLAEAHRAGGQPALAVAALEPLVERLQRERPGSVPLAGALAELGHARIEAFEGKGAREAFEQAQSIYRALEIPFGVAAAEAGLAQLAYQHDRWAESVHRYAHSLSIFEEILSPDDSNLLEIRTRYEDAKRVYAESRASGSTSADPPVRSIDVGPQPASHAQVEAAN